MTFAPLLCRLLPALWPLLLLGSGAAWAQAQCNVSATPVVFGGYDPFAGTPLDSAGSVTVQCELLAGIGLLVSYTVSLSPGAAGSFAPRRMASGGATMAYNLYTDFSRTAVWGDGSAGTANVSDGYLLALPASRSYPMYGRVGAGQNLPPGSFVDAVTVTVNY